MPLRTCLHPGCPTLVARGRCAEHQPTHERASRGESWEWRKWYRRARWLRLRARVLAEEPLCRLCKEEGRTTATAEVDHIQPHRGDERLFFLHSNLQGLCASHHAAKTAAGA